MSDGGMNVYGGPNIYGSSKRKLAHFDILMNKMREAVKHDLQSIPVTVHTELNPIDNTISIKIEAHGIINNWGERFNMPQEEHQEKIQKLSDYLGNMFQELIPECENECCSNVDYDKLIDELCLRAAVYSYNYTGSMTAEAVESFIEQQRKEEEKEQIRNMSKVKANRNPYYHTDRIHYSGELGGKS